MHSEASVEIERPIDEVFKAVTEHVVQWSQYIVEHQVLEATADGVGTIFRCVVQQNGRRMEFLGAVTRHEPPHATAAYLRGPAFNVEGEYALDDLGSRTRVTQVSRLQGKGFMKVVFFLSGWAMKRVGNLTARSELDSLKRFCETHVLPAAGD